jgi:ribonuclease HII
MSARKFDRSLIPPRPDLSFEQQLWGLKIHWVAGVDEAGRGALAGPVVAGAVVLPNLPDMAERLSGVRDSKQMTARERQRQAEVIREIAVSTTWGLSTNQEIDEIGILPATRQAVHRALLEMERKPEHLLIDHISVPEVGLEETILTKGDCRSLSIAAASIIAKVTRDALMVRLDEEYPAYGFASHKGYGTARHLAALAAHGPCPAHRRSFAPLKEGPQLDLL